MLRNAFRSGLNTHTHNKKPKNILGCYLIKQKGDHSFISFFSLIIILIA